MNQIFKGKRILVTGGCRGIGYGIAVELWRQGASVVALSSIKENLLKLKSQYPTIEVVCVDLLDWDRTREAVESLGVFDGLVNNAGVALNQPFLECTKEYFDETIAVNVRAVVNVSQIVAKKMIQNGIKGSIVNISSQASKAALKDHVSYCGSKAAVDGITRVMALELGPYGIRSNTVNPTVIMTEMGRKVWSEPSKSHGMLSKIPLGRFGEVHEVVNAVLFLLSDQASMISGVHLPIDGGFLAL
ncbi:D-erythrulose reductase-like [Plodia interpunctella]|uniref:D-erythrulose reductase-like n=1 Tax=Plodia interpunctella TaxID=58824 RepID=UPI002367CA1A|nr:D-erythrulose reductase-like [Plodia interpunctella]